MDKKRVIIYTILFAILVAIGSIGFTEFGMGGLIIPMAVVMVYFTIFFIVATIIKDNSIVDMGWGFGFVLGALATLYITEEPTLLSFLLTGFIAVWGLRLSARLVKRNWGKPEDFRYAQWRKDWGDKVVITAFFRVFMIQGIINFIVGSAAYTVIKFNQFEFGEGAYISVLVAFFIALTGLFFEVVGDEQLRRHIAKGERKLLQTGLWSITRHPNYFGEILIWVGIFLTGITLYFSGSVSLVFYSLLFISPLLMSTVLLKISTPLLEKNMEKYDGWDAYKQKTPMVFPFGKKG